MKNQFKPIPGFKCVEFKHEIQKKIYEKTKKMSTEQLVDYFKKNSKKDPLFNKMKFFQKLK